MNICGSLQDPAAFEGFPSDPLAALREREQASFQGPREEKGDRLGMSRAARLESPTSVLGALKTSPMGDHIMVDAALDGHQNLLRDQASILDPSCRLLDGPSPTLTILKPW